MKYENNNIEKLSIIEELMRLTVIAESFEELAQLIVDKCSNLLEAELCTLWRLIKEEDEDELILSASKGFERKPGEEIPIYKLNWDEKNDKNINGVTAWLAIRRKPINFISYSDLHNHPAHRGRWDEAQWEGKAEQKFRSFIGIPLTVQNDVVGVLKWENSIKENGFTDVDYSLAQQIAPFIAIALQSLNVHETQERERQEVLRKLMVSLLSPFEPIQLYQQIVDTTAKLLTADICSLWLCDDGRKSLKLAAAHGVKDKHKETPEYKLNWDAKNDSTITGLTAWVAIRAKSFYARYFEDLEKHPSHEGKWDQAQWDDVPEIHFGSLYAVPLIVNEKVFGVLKIERRVNKPFFNDVNKSIFELMANFIGLALELSSRLRQDVVFDFFHLLKQPASNGVSAFQDLRRELEKGKNARPERIEKRLDQMAKNLESIRGWTNNVYALASARITDEKENKTTISLISYIQDAIRDLGQTFPEFKYEIHKDVEKYAVSHSLLEKKKFHVILYNILNNSIKYSEKNCSIKIWTEKSRDKYLSLNIEDNGKGLSPDEKKFMFDPYFTRAAEKWPGSMGLGLTTVERLLREFDYKKEVLSEVNKGTIFKIRIPINKILEVNANG
ncbi:MAG: GAF domain-containing protein [Bacteroidales bacterium]|nr:GAF domain-containing protein [Bacteroidales bacterium]